MSTLSCLALIIPILFTRESYQNLLCNDYHTLTAVGLFIVVYTFNQINMFFTKDTMMNGEAREGLVEIE